MPLANLLSDSSDDESSDDQSSSRGVRYLIGLQDFSHIESVRPYCHVLPQLADIIVKLPTENQQAMLETGNKLLDDAHETSQQLYTFITLNYRSVWPDLESLIRNPVSYAHVICIAGEDISTLLSRKDQLTEFLRNDEVLALSISASAMTRDSQSVIDKLGDKRYHLVMEAAEIVVEIESQVEKIGNYLSKRAYSLAPNVAAIVGPTTCAQLLATLGLEGLCKTPACNYASYGANNSKIVPGNGSSIRSKGYIYHCPLVQMVSDDHRKQAMRQVSAKVALASRIDYSNRNEPEKNNRYGVKWHDEIEKKLKKLQGPPETQRVKPLPKPVDKKSTKRGGRRIRKQKERSQMSEIEKAQNRMAFGEKEETRMNTFGEEIGLGMVGKLSNGGSYRKLAATNRPQATKSLNKKLEKFGNGQQKRDSKLLGLIDHDEPITKRPRLE